MSSTPEPTCKKQKSNHPSDLLTTVTCKHFVTRKKRFCKMTVAKDQEYCGEHIPQIEQSAHEDSYISEAKKQKRIPCPLDAKHTVYAWNLKKHLKICNAKAKDLPEFIVSGINVGTDDDGEVVGTIKLSEIDIETLEIVIDKVNRLFDEHVADTILELFLKHDVLDSEVNNEEYGSDTLKHLVQTSSILGILKHLNFLSNNTSFIEFGAGKGQVSFWLAQIIKDLFNTNVVLVDRASLRHKKDNKVIERDVIHRIRADIADFVVDNLDVCQKDQHIVGVSKHLCGAATDLALRCILNGREKITKGFVIALCCHHRCDWKPFVGKKFLIENNVSKREFVIMTKMVSWAICGSGMSRETRKAMQDRQNGLNGIFRITSKTSYSNRFKFIIIFYFRY